MDQFDLPAAVRRKISHPLHQRRFSGARTALDDKFTPSIRWISELVKAGNEALRRVCSKKKAQGLCGITHIKTHSFRILMKAADGRREAAAPFFTARFSACTAQNSRYFIVFPSVQFGSSEKSEKIETQKFVKPRGADSRNAVRCSFARKLQNSFIQFAKKRRLKGLQKSF
ncbi:hypothetical protein ANACOL_00562 [Anaerotruncus colihominis DSM 17241]|uniref:Uncharacterized protein n=1 Tax=Anaerotruncus colihominis DSM 17241 TaxID=445972 RepID=B0P734_9FIRM|nr:hypothetical protein ANACOL_00562 [Anaerotruncus colihominis DSM 17241]